MRVALVHDWLDTWGGGEAVLAELLQVFPGADIYTLVDFLTRADRARLGNSRIGSPHRPDRSPIPRHARMLSHNSRHEEVPYVPGPTPPAVIAL